MNYPYLATFGRGFLNKFEAVLHQLYLCMKIPMAKVVITVHGNQELARDIERVLAPGQRNVHHLEADTQPPPIKEPKRDKEKINFKQNCQVKKVLLDMHMPDKMVTINATLDEQEEKELLEFLCKNKDTSAWSASDLWGVSRDIIEHRFDIDPLIGSKKQKLTKCLMTKLQQSKQRFRG
jgi:hypothetical protein